MLFLTLLRPSKTICALETPGQPAPVQTDVRSSSIEKTPKVMSCRGGVGETEGVGEALGLSEELTVVDGVALEETVVEGVGVDEIDADGVLDGDEETDGVPEALCVLL